MPTYQELKTYEAGFYNNKRTGDTDDRVYSAKDVREPYCTVFSKGIMPDTDGTAGGYLKVTAVSGMQISVAAGTANLGAWFKNKGEYRITLDPAGGAVRYDCVIIRSDDISTTRSDNVAVDREPSIYIKSLTAVPTINDLIRNDNTYEMCLAYVKVNVSAASISSADIIDTRTDGSLCNVMSGVGAMVVRVYKNTYFSEAAGQTVIPIGISQYNKSKDALSVIVEGRTFTEGANYTITDNSKITLAIGLPVVGTKIEFEVAKNVNAAGAETVVQEVAELRKEMTANNKKLEHHYYCNGTNDNVLISQIAQNYINGGTDYGSMKLVIHGHFGAAAPYAGTGTSGNRYQWFVTSGLSSSPNRKLILDFSDCGQITLPIEVGTYNDIFSGYDANIIGANVVAAQSGTNTMIRVFSSANGAVYAENCRFWITASLASYISQTGTFVRCRGSVTVAGANAYCFYATANALLRIHGGEYYAYTTGSNTSAVVYGTAATGVSILYAVNCPTVARSGYVQSYAVYLSAGNNSLTDTMTTLAITATGANIRGTLAVSKAGQM